ncbi:MAG: signal peptidase II [Actinomycetota bacterium]
MRRYQLLIVAAVILLDQLTKLLVVHGIPVGEEIPIVPGLFQLSHWENAGAAFSMFANSNSPWRAFGLIAFSVAACIVVTYLLWKHGPELDTSSVSLCLILGGALGNLWDRLAKARVTDFLDFYIGDHHWPPFNVADSAIVVGAVLLIVTILFAQRRERSAR